jgi:iron(III) transport system ATP-binding protein
MAERDGRVVRQNGAPQQLSDALANLFVATFMSIGNTREGQVIKTDGERLFQTTSGDIPTLACGTGKGAIVLRPQNIGIVRDNRANTLAGANLHRGFSGGRIRHPVATAGREIVVDESHGSGVDRYKNSETVIANRP